MTYKRLDAEGKMAQHQGVFRKQLSLWQGIVLIVSTMIGAGVLGIPYAVARVGILPGLFYIVSLGLLMMGLNLMLGEVTVRTKEKLQLPGLAHKYLGKSAKVLMMLFMYLSLFGILLVYIIGVGETLATMFPGGDVFWSLVFFALGSLLIFFGLRTIKQVELFLVLGILAVVLLISALSVGSINLTHVSAVDFSDLLFPYGVILFSFLGTVAVAETHAVLEKKPNVFKHAIIWSSIIAMIVYSIFAFVVVGVTGPNTTEIATIGLGQAIGPTIFLLGNIFAVLAMGTSFLMVGVSLRDSFMWDLKWPKHVAFLTALGVPFTLFVLGLRNFIGVLDIVGGVFGSAQMIMIILIYWRAKHKSDIEPTKYKLHHTMLLSAVLLLAFSVGAVYSVLKQF